VVAFGALMNIVLIWLQDMEIHVHLILGAVLASMLGAVIFLIAELDNPFRGAVSIGPESIARVYETVMKPGESPPDKANNKMEDAAKTAQPEAPIRDMSQRVASQVGTAASGMADTGSELASSARDRVKSGGHYSASVRVGKHRRRTFGRR
jgi:hypothetical protein